MIRDREYVPALSLHYKYYNGKAVFEDGVEYSLAEMLFLARTRARGETLVAVHKVKKIFDGVILTNNIEEIL